MALQMLTYQRKQEKQKEEGESALDMLMKGLQVAGAVTGIYQNVQQAKAASLGQERTKLETEALQKAESAKGAALERAQRGRMTEPEYQETLASQKFVEVAQPKEGEVLPPGVLKRFVIGEKGEERPVLLRQTRPLEMEAKAESEKFKSDLQSQIRDLKEKTRLGERGEDIKMKKLDRLQSRYEADPVTKQTKEIGASWQRVQGAFEDPSAAGDLSLIFGYMKMLDPGSTVREGEFANAQNSGGIPDKIQARYNQVLQGTRLSTTQRQDFFKQAQNVVAGQFKQQKKIDDAYKDQLKRAGTTPEDFLFVPELQVKEAPGQRGASPTGRALKASQLPNL